MAQCRTPALLLKSNFGNEHERQKKTTERKCVSWWCLLATIEKFALLTYFPPRPQRETTIKTTRTVGKNPTNVWVLDRQKWVNKGNNKAKLSLVALHCTRQCSTQSFLWLSQRWLLKEICQGPVCGLIGSRVPELGSNVVRQFRGQGVHWGREKGIDDTSLWMYRPKMHPSQVSSTELPL